MLRCRVPTELVDRLSQIAKAKASTKAQITRDALVDYLNKEEAKLAERDGGKNHAIPVPFSKKVSSAKKAGDQKVSGGAAPSGKAKPSAKEPG
jgi:hypothetical protein